MPSTDPRIECSYHRIVGRNILPGIWHHIALYIHSSAYLLLHYTQTDQITRTFFYLRLMTDEYFMQQALKEANKAFESGEVPVGAVVIMNEKIIARGHNQVELLNDPTAHAEIIALTSAFNYLGSKYLPEATIYITVEPCLMCAGALYWSKVSRIIWGADDEKNGHKRITEPNWPFHPKTEVVKGILKEECGELMRRFFKERRG